MKQNGRTVSDMVAMFLKKIYVMNTSKKMNSLYGMSPNGIYIMPDNWSIVEKISVLQRRVIVYSIQYYDYGASVISDRQFDRVARQLEELTKTATKEECEKSRYWYCMYDFTHATGFDLQSRLNDHDREYLEHIADIVLDNYRNRHMGRNYEQGPQRCTVQP